MYFEHKTNFINSSFASTNRRVVWQKFADRINWNVCGESTIQETESDRWIICTFSWGNFMEIKLIINLVSSVSGAKAKYSSLANNKSKIWLKLGDMSLFPTSTNIPLRIYLDKFHRTTIPLLPSLQSNSYDYKTMKLSAHPFHFL